LNHRDTETTEVGRRIFWVQNPEGISAFLWVVQPSAFCCWFGNPNNLVSVLSGFSVVQLLVLNPNEFWSPPLPLSLFNLLVLFRAPKRQRAPAGALVRRLVRSAG